MAVEVPGREVPTLGDCGFMGSGGGARSGSELSHLFLRFCVSRRHTPAIARETRETVGEVKGNDGMRSGKRRDSHSHSLGDGGKRGLINDDVSVWGKKSKYLGRCRGREAGREQGSERPS